MNAAFLKECGQRGRKCNVVAAVMRIFVTHITNHKASPVQPPRLRNKKLTI